MQPEELARIDIAAFSGDLWEAGRGPAFFRTVLKAPNIQWLHMFSAGTDDPVFAAVRSKGTRVTSSIGASARPIAHTVIMQMLALCRNIPQAHQSMVEGRWDRKSFMGTELAFEFKARVLTSAQVAQGTALE